MASTPNHGPDPMLSHMVVVPLRGREALFSATALLIALNVVVALAMFVYGAGSRDIPHSIQLAWGANFGPATKDGEWWRLGTAMFLHFGPVHLGMNMLALWDGGRYVERLFGPARLVALFLVSGLAGNLLSLVMQGDGAVSGGASGAIFGIYGALLAYLALCRRHVHPADFRWLFGGGALFAAATLAMGMFIRGVDNGAHLGGLVAGAATGFVLTDHANSPQPGPASARLIIASTLLVGAALLAWNLPEPRYAWREEKLAREEIREFIGEDARINARLRSILAGRPSDGSSFDQLAGEIESEIAQSYDRSFDQLSSLHLSPAAPSADTVERLKRYAEARRDASHALADGLRERDEARVREAIESARQAAGASRSGR